MIFPVRAMGKLKINQPVAWRSCTSQIRYSHSYKNSTPCGQTAGGDRAPRIYVYVCIHTHIHTHLYIYIYIYTHTPAYVYSHIHTHIHLHIYIYTSTCIHTCIYIYTHIHTHTYTYIYIYTHTHIHEYTYIHIHIYMLRWCSSFQFEYTVVLIPPCIRSTGLPQDRIRSLIVKAAQDKCSEMAGAATANILRAANRAQKYGRRTTKWQYIKATITKLNCAF